MISKPGPYPIKIRQSATFDRSFRIKNKVGSNLVAVNLTGYSAKAVIKERPKDETGVLELTVGNGIVITGAQGLVQVRINGIQTGALPVKKMSWTLWIREPDGDWFPTLTGPFEVIPA